MANDYGTFGGQPEHMANTPTWAMDNRIYSRGYGVSFRAQGDTWQRGPGLGRGQWGLCQDDAGRLFFNYNSDLLRADLLPAAAFSRNPLLRTASSVNFQVMRDQAVFPSHPTPASIAATIRRRCAKTARWPVRPPPAAPLSTVATPSRPNTVATRSSPNRPPIS